MIPQERTAVPVEWDDLRQHLEKLTQTAAADPAGRRQHAGSVRQHRRRQPARPGRDHPGHHHQALAGGFGARRPQQRLFSTVKNLSILVSALQSSTDLMRQLNQNLAAVTGLLANEPNEVGNAVAASTTWSATSRASSPTTARRWARRRTSWRRCPQR